MLSERAERVIYAARLRAVSRDNPLLEDLPDWVTNYREHQVTAVKEILEGFQHGRLVVLDAPTGSGKTLIAETVRRLMRVRGVYCCNSKMLQAQVGHDFPDSRLLMGRANYLTELYGDGGKWDVTCADCTKDSGECRFCLSVHSCPYERAKHEALTHDLSLLNTSYLLTEGNGPGRFRGRDLAILDEADTLEQELMRYVSVAVRREDCVRYGLSEPAKVTKADSWREWLEFAIPRLVSGRNQIQGNDIRSERTKARLQRLIDKLRFVLKDIDEGWVYTGKGGRVEFKPVSVEKWGKELLWPLADRFLLMSATVISPAHLLSNLGWDEDYSVVRVPSTFPTENRRTIIFPAVKMTRKNENGPKDLIEPLRLILARHSGERVLVHCVSYQLASELCDGVSNGSRENAGRRYGTYTESAAKNGALAELRQHEGYVLFAPSMDRGVDLADDDCRVVVIAKIPYPNLGDRQISARLHSKGGQEWYTVQTVRTIVQMTGRGVRHKDDFCTNYILDAQFLDLWNKGRGLFPKWWTEAIQWQR